VKVSSVGNWVIVLVVVVVLFLWSMNKGVIVHVQNVMRRAQF
jgi:hypothetical protein